MYKISDEQSHSQAGEDARLYYCGHMNTMSVHVDSVKSTHAFAFDTRKHISAWRTRNQNAGAQVFRFDNATE